MVILITLLALICGAPFVLIGFLEWCDHKERMAKLKNNKQKQL